MDSASADALWRTRNTSDNQRQYLRYKNPTDLFQTTLAIQIIYLRF